MKWVPWILLALACAWIFVRETLDPVVPTDTQALRRIDSLEAVVRAREQRIAADSAEAQALRDRQDSILAHRPPPETLYLKYREKAAGLDYMLHWRDMGIITRDTSAAGHVSSLVGGEAGDH